MGSTVGFVVPSINSVFESDLRWLPDTITPRVERIPTMARSEDSEAGTLARVDSMNRGLMDALSELMHTRLDMVAYACTAGSFFSKWPTPARLEEYLSEVAAVPSKSTAGAIIEMLDEFRSSRIALFGPYAPAVNQAMADVLEAAGFSIVQVETDPWFLEPGVHIGAEPPEDIASFVVKKLAPEAELVLLPCTGWRALEARESIENARSVRVVTANQALFRSISKTLGVDSSDEMNIRSS